MIRATYLRDGYVPRTRQRPTILGPALEPEVDGTHYAASRYGADRPRWGMIGFVVLTHLVVLVALVKFDVIHVDRVKPVLTEVELLQPDPVPPPAAPEQKPQDKQTRQETPPLAPPPPIVAVNAPPPPLQVAPPAPPPPPPAPPVAAPARVSDGPTLAVGLPRTLSKVAIKYPMEARRRHQQGVVRLRVTIAPDGSVSEVVVATTSGYESLDKAALAAVREWRFQPRIEAGMAVSAMGYIPIPFTLT